MSTFLKGLLRPVNPIQQCKRFRGKINIQRPQKLFFERQLVVDVAKPTYDDFLPPLKKCGHVFPKKRHWDVKVHNPYEDILAKECINWFNHSKLVAFYHVNSVAMDDRFDTYKALKKENMHIVNYGKKIIKMAVENTPFEEVQVFFNCHTDIIFSEEVKITKLLKIMKGLPQLILLGGIVDGKLLSRNDLMKYSKFPSLDIARAQLCQTLEMTASNLVSQMTQQQNQLVQSLDRYVEMKNAPSEPEIAAPEKTSEPANNENT